MKITAKTAIIVSSIVISAGIGIYTYLKPDQGEVLSWMSSSWLYRRSITVSNSSTELTNEDVLIVYDTASLITAGKLQNDCDDLRFVDSDDSTSLAYWVEGGCNTSTTHIWLRVPTLPVGGKTIYMYYGNSSATNSEETWTGKFYLMKDSACDTGWATESSSGGDYFEKFPYASSSFGTTGGSARHTHSNTNLQTNTTAISQNINRSSGVSTALNHYHEITVSMDAPISDILPPYLDMIFCSNNDLVVKQDTVSLFDSSVPLGFTRFSELDSKFPRGNSTYGGSSLTTTHTHTLNSAITNIPSATGTCRSGTTQVPTSTHTHILSSFTSQESTMLPEYLTMIYGQADSDIMAPSNTIVMSNDIPPLGWSSFSPLTGKFPYAFSSYGSTGGSTTHTHSVNTTTQVESATVGCSTNAPRTSRMLTHSHTVQGELNSGSNNPPYIETLFVQKKGSQTATVNNEEVQNSIPNTPTNLLTETSSNPTGVTDTTPEFSAIFSDPNTTDTGNYFEVEVNTQSDFLGTSMWDSEQTAITPINNGSRSSDISYNGTTLTLNGTTYYWRIRFWDSNGDVSPWSSVSNFTMDIANSTPNTPSSLYLDLSSNPTKVTNPTPEFSAIFSDSDTLDTGNYFEIEVNTQTDFLGTSIWDTNKTVITPITNGERSSAIPYEGVTLSLDGSTYYWRIRFWDNNESVSEWSTTATFTMSGPPYIPTSLLTEGSANATEVSDLTPEFSAIYSDPNNDSGTYYEIEVNSNNTFTGTVMWDSDKTVLDISNNSRIPDISYNGTTLTLNGATYYWRIRFWDSEEGVSEWSTTSSFTLLLNISPNAPSSLYAEQTTNPTNIFDLNPEFSAIFTDINGTDTATQYEIEVNSNDSFTGSVMWDSNQIETVPITNGERSSEIEYEGTSLTLDGTTYYWRIRFWDSKGSVSEWSVTQSFTMYDATPISLDEEGGEVEGAGVDDYIQFSGVGLQGIKVSPDISN